MNWDELAKKLRTHAENAKRCWQVWEFTRSSNHPVPEKGLTAFQNRIHHFQHETALPTPVVMRMAKVLYLVEQEVMPGYETEGAPAPQPEASSAPPVEERPADRDSDEPAPGPVVPRRRTRNR